MDPGDNAPKIIETCGKLGASVKAILLTHGHFDHVMAMEELRLKYKAPVFASEQEAGVLADPDKNLPVYERRPLFKSGQAFEGSGGIRADWISV